MFPKKINKAVQQGFAAIEMTLIAPIFMLLIVAAVDITHLIQANHTIISISREGGNIISRSNTDTPQEVMDIIATTSGTLDMTQDGVIYITELVGQEDASPYIKSQYRWNQHGLSKNSAIWSSCSNWASDGECSDVDADNPPLINNLAVTLDEGEIVYSVEVFYDYSPIFSRVFDDEYILSDTTYM
ncbi:pilus assembly protein [Vibrio chagasii]|uniref:TadE family protein n=1 Tax=Vibrio chagasii TaxID=170679 RepID=UPI0035A725A3